METGPKMTHILELAGKEFKAAITAIANVCKRTHNKRNDRKYRREVETRKKNRMEIL